MASRKKKGKSPAGQSSTHGKKANDNLQVGNFVGGQDGDKQVSLEPKTISTPVMPVSTPSIPPTKPSRTVSAPESRSSQLMVGDAGVPVHPPLLKRFYEALALLFILGQNRGDRTDEDELELDPEPEEISSQKLRRSFTKHLAYLCDYEKGGDTTCAIALQQTPQRIVYHFASNKGSSLSAGAKDRIRGFLEEVLTTLRTSSLESASTLESLLFEKSVEYSSARIADYSKFLAGELKYVLNHMDDANIGSEPTFVKWLAELQDAIPRPIHLCSLCYESRNSDFFRSLAQRSSSGAPCAGRFEKIRHLVGRLNHTMKAIKVAVATRIRLPHLFDNFEVIRASSAPVSHPPLQERNPSLFAIAGRLIWDPKGIESCREALNTLDSRFQLSPRLHDLCTSPNWRPRVHAELILLDLFWTKKMEFVGDDRYIGCSKPACFCCYHYIIAHPGRFVTPACHNNHWPNWRPPDVSDPEDQTSIKLREKILNEMVKKIRVEVLDQIREQRGPRTRQPDSNTEISSTLLRSVHLSIEEILEGRIDAISPDDSVAGDNGDFEDDGEGAWMIGGGAIPGLGANFESEDDEDSEGGVSLGGVEK